MTARDDAVRAAVTPLLDDLRGDLLVMPDEHIVEQHLEMMTFEQTVLATPRFVQPRARQKMPRPRRALIALLAAFTTIVSCGLSAAGALPAPLQHITESIAHTFGVPHPNGKASSHGNAAGDSPSQGSAARPAPSATAPKTATPTQPALAASTTPTTVHKARVVPPTTSTTIALPSAATPIAANRPHTPSGRVTPDPVRTPSMNSSNTPPGFPADWRDQAATAAAAELVLMCPQATTPTAVGCPQAVAVPDLFALQGVQWSILNQPYDGAVVIAKTTPGNPARHIAPTTAVTVYEAFQMVATYVVNDGLTHYAYSAGIGAATMTWNGSSFVNVSFGQGSVAGQLLPGIKAPTIPRPSVDDAHVLGAVQSAFMACAAPGTSDGPVSTCPQTSAAGEQWTIPTDPTQGATIAYEPTQGLLTVTGTYAMASNLGNTASGPYTALVFYDGTQPHVISITAG